MNVGKKVIINTTVQILGKVASIVLGFISIILLTRYLGVSGYGNFSLVFTYLSFFGFLSDMGLGLLVVRDISNNKVKYNKSLSIYISFKLFLTSFAVVVALLALFFFPYNIEIKNAIIIGSIAVAIGSLSSFGSSFLQAQLRMDLVTLIDQVTKLITVLFILIFVILKFNFLFIVSSVLFGNIFGFIITLYVLKDKFKPYKVNRLFALKYFNIGNKVIKDSLLIGIMTLFAYTYFKIDSLLLSIYKPSAELGTYTLAYKIVENILLLWGFYMATIYPLLSRFYVEDHKKYKIIFFNSIKTSIFISTICIFIGFFYATTLIKIFGGQNFNSSILPLRILIFSIPFFLINNILYHSFISSNKIIQVIVCLLFSLIFNTVLNIIFIPIYSYVASSYITVITEIILLISYLISSYYFSVKNEV